MEETNVQEWNAPTAPPVDVPVGMNVVWNGEKWVFVPNPVFKAPE